MPHDHPQFIGDIGVYGSRKGNFAIQNCDLLISIGSRLDTRQTGGNLKTFPSHDQGSYNEYIDDLTGNLEKDKDNLIDILHSPLKYEKKLDYSILKSKKEFANKHLELYESISNRR